MVATVLTVYGIETHHPFLSTQFSSMLQQSLPFTVCAEGCETAEERSDDEVRTSQVPERSEGKTKVMKQQYLPFTVLKLSAPSMLYTKSRLVATVLTVYGIETLNPLYVQRKHLERLQQSLPFTVLKLTSPQKHTNLKITCCNSPYRLRY